MNPKQFLWAAGILFCSLWLGYISLFVYQIGAPLHAEWWVHAMYQYKDYLADSCTQKKIIIFGGSNSLFGINSEVIAEKTGLPVVNLSTHAGLDLDFILYKIQQHIHPGDIVVLPLEFEYYWRDGTISQWFSENMMAWGGII